LEACGTAHYWARRARALGHQVTLLPAQYVRPYVRRNKTDRTDAEALLEAVRSGGIPPVTVKTVAQQELQALHRVRAEWMATRTARINAMRGFLQEHGLTISRGARTALQTIPRLLADADAPIPPRLRALIARLLADVRALDDDLAALERELTPIADEGPVAQRLLRIPGIGVITATALLARPPIRRQPHRIFSSGQSSAYPSARLISRSRPAPRRPIRSATTRIGMT
jgi:transposase